MSTASERLRQLGWRPAPDDPGVPLEDATYVARAEDVPVRVEVSLPATFRRSPERRAESRPAAPSGPARTITKDAAPAWVSRLRDAGIDARWERRGMSVPEGQRAAAERVLRQIDAEGGRP